MSGFIPEHTIEEVRLATDIVELVSDYVTLKKRGQNFFGLCPFHKEKTPSFSVHPDKQIFRCFGCGAGGNAFMFLMRHEGSTFPEAVEFLAKRAGIELEYTKTDEDVPGQAKVNESLYHVNEFAANWFHVTLMAQKGQAARTYLNQRGLKNEHIEHFELGYAPNSWDGLLQEANRTSNDIETLISAGLLMKKEDRTYDRFRDRIIFPIRNLSGRVIAFGGRNVIDKENSPKYINSPETSVYEKSKILYGLFQNKDEIRKQDEAVFVEGYMDLLSLAVHGIQHVVATSGTALTEEQARLIRRYTKNVVLLYDSDSAGFAAAIRGADVLLENDVHVRIASLPDKHDPDSFVQQHGKGATLQLIASAPTLFDFKLHTISRKDPEKQTDSIQSLLESLSKVSNNIERSLLVTKAAETLKVSEKDLWKSLDAILLRSKGKGSSSSQIGQHLNDLGKSTKSNKTERALKDLVRILIHDWSLSEYIFTHLDFADISDTKMSRILVYLKNQFKGEAQPAQEDIIHKFDDVEISEFLINELNKKWEGSDLERWAFDCITSIKTERLNDRIAALRAEIKDVQHDPQRVSELLEKCMQLENEKKSLHKIPSLKGIAPTETS